MRLSIAASAVSLLALAGFGSAQFPSAPEGVTVLDSKFGDGVRLSWKEVGYMPLPGVQRYPGTDETPTERHLRNNRRRQKLFRLRPPATRQPRRPRRRTRLPHQHLLLVLRGPQEPRECAFIHLDERRARQLVYAGPLRRERAVLRSLRLELDLSQRVCLEQ